MGSRRPKRRRIVATVAALAVAAGLLSAPFGGDSASVGPEDFNTAIDCQIGTSTAELPAWACPSPAGGHFWAWFMAPDGPWPEAMKIPGGRPPRPSRIAEDGAVQGGADALDAVLWWIMAVGSHGQAPFTPPSDWQWQEALFPINRAKANASAAAKTALDFLKTKIGTTCPETVYLKARIGYVGYAVGADPRAFAACDLVDAVEKADNPATGQYGTGLKDTVWSVYLLNAYASFIDPKTTDYLVNSARNDGGWAADGSKTGPLDIEMTARVTMALTALAFPANDAVFEKAVAALAAVQNSDTGFGKPSSTSWDTGHVYGMLNDLGEAGTDYFPKFKATSSVPGAPNQVKVARFQMSWFAGVIMVNPCTNSPTEGRFFATMAERVARLGPNAAPDCSKPEPAPTPALANTVPQSAAMFFVYFSDPVRGQAAPPETTPPPAAPPEAAPVTPTVTG